MSTLLGSIGQELHLRAMEYSRTSSTMKLLLFTNKAWLLRLCHGVNLGIWQLIEIPIARRALERCRQFYLRPVFRL